MQQHIDRTEHTNRYFEIGIAVLAFFITCSLGTLAVYVLLALSALSAQ